MSLVTFHAEWGPNVAGHSKRWTLAEFAGKRATIRLEGYGRAAKYDVTVIGTAMRDGELALAVHPDNDPDDVWFPYAYTITEIFTR